MFKCNFLIKAASTVERVLAPFCAIQGYCHPSTPKLHNVAKVRSTLLADYIFFVAIAQLFFPELQTKGRLPVFFRGRYHYNLKLTFECVVWTGLSSLVSTLEKICAGGAELQQLLVKWRLSEVCRAPTPPPFSENSQPSQ